MPQKKATLPAKRAAKAPAKVAAPAVVAEGDATTQVKLQVAITLPSGDQLVLDTGDIAKGITNGFEFTLAKAVKLGSVADLIKWVGDTFSVSVPDPSGWPAPFDGLVAMPVTVKSFHIDTTKDPTVFSLEIAVEKNPDKPPKIPLINVTIDSIGFGIAKGEPFPTAPA